MDGSMVLLWGRGGGRGSSGMESDGDIRALEGSASLKVKYPLDWIGLASRLGLAIASDAINLVQHATIYASSAGTWIRVRVLLLCLGTVSGRGVQRGPESVPNTLNGPDGDVCDFPRPPPRSNRSQCSNIGHQVQVVRQSGNGTERYGGDVEVDGSPNRGFAY